MTAPHPTFRADHVAFCCLCLAASLLLKSLQYQHKSTSALALQLSELLIGTRLPRRNLLPFSICTGSVFPSCHHLHRPTLSFDSGNDDNNAQLQFLRALFVSIQTLLRLDLTFKVAQTLSGSKGFGDSTAQIKTSPRYQQAERRFFSSPHQILPSPADITSSRRLRLSSTAHTPTQPANLELR